MLCNAPALQGNIEATASNSHASAGKHIHTALNSCLLSLRSASQHSPCGKFVRLGSSRPQAQGFRSALAARSACSAVACVPSVVRKLGADGIYSRIAPTVKPEACGFFSSFSCPHKKRTCFSPLKKEKEKQQEHTCSAPAVLFLQSYQSLIKGSSAT